MLSFSITYDGPLALKARDRNNIHRDAVRLTVKLWRRMFLPIHFTETGFRKYRYTPRRGQAGSGWRGRNIFRSYHGRKEDQQGHSDPLKFTGDSMRNTLSRRTVKARATSKIVHGETVLGRQWNRRNPDSKVKMHEEIRRITNAEIKVLEKAFVKHVEKSLRRLGSARKVKVRIGRI